MGSGYLYGWDPVGEGWVKVVCNPDGELDIDATAIFEDSPTDGELEKGPTSNWAYDHDADANAHHTPPTAGDFNHQDLANRGANDHHTPPVAGDFNHQDLANRGADDHHAKYTDAEAIAAAAVYENPPTEDESAKAPTSEWAFDHDADVDAHHVKYTDADARGSIDDIYDADGKATRNISFNYTRPYHVEYIQFNQSAVSKYNINLRAHLDVTYLSIQCYRIGVGYVDADFKLYRTDHYVDMIHDESFQAALALYLEENPTNGVVNKAPTSNWAFDHDADANAHHTKYTDAEAIAAAAVYENPPTENEATKAPTSEWAFDHNANAAAHHAKYTDLEAQTACNLNGDLYWSLPGHGWLTENPDTDSVRRHSDGYIQTDVNGVAYRAPVHLPHGATVTRVKVFGNVGTEDEDWILRRFKLSNQVTDDMATAACNTEDVTISNAVIDNSQYNYYLMVQSSTATDRFYGATIKYTL